MWAKIADKIRFVFFLTLVALMFWAAAVSLMKIQVVNGSDYGEKALATRTATQVITSPRGEITDITGRKIVSNKVGYNVIIEKAFFPSGDAEINGVILKTARILEADGVVWNDSLPITKETPFEFLESKESEIARLRKNIGVQPYATASDCMARMAEMYAMAEGYDETQLRTVSGVRYEMLIRNFSVSNRFTFAEDIDTHTVLALKEASYRLPGLDIIEEAIRYYSISDAAPHLIGATGAIDETDDIEKLLEEGYALNDMLGKSGIEYAMEEVLRGQKGERAIEMHNDAVVSDVITLDAVPGSSIKLSFDADFQKKVQKILENHIKWSQNQTHYMAKGTEATGGAIVVLDVKTGAVLAAATAPTYDLNLYKEDPASVLNIENQALYNRAISGLYRPGSTFKIVTAAAALNEGVIDANTTFVCNNEYSYWADVGFKPRCTGWHGRIDVVTALEKSCNIFFYETGRIMGIDTLAGYANSFGMGVDTGFEIRGQEGRIATPESYEKIKLDWQAGNVVMAAIGQAETSVTPLQMAVSAMTVANRGVRYEPFLVDSVYDYNMNSLISATTPEVAETIPDKTGYTFDTVIQGMKQAANFVPMTYPTEKQYYTDYLLTSLPGQAAIKTGTPQMTSAEDTGSAFVGFYPADDPEIAFSCFVEHGDFSKLMIKQIIEAYYDKNYVVKNPVIVENPDMTGFLAGLEG